MWLPQGGALKIENLQFTQYSIIMIFSSTLADTQYHTTDHHNIIIDLIVLYHY